MPITIKSRWDSSIVRFHSDTATTVSEAIAEAKKKAVSLSESNLSGADLSESNLSKSDLSGADLSGSDLSESDLSGADLRGSDLSESDLRGSDLRESDLSGADLRGSDLRESNLSGADLSGANLSKSNLSGSVGLTLENIVGKPMEVPVIPNIHQAVLAAIQKEGCSLDMSAWHSCDTTHCRAGWVVHLAGKAGKALEERIGTPAAARRIYRASDPSSAKGMPFRFYTDNDAAMADIIACAEREKATVST